MRARHWTQAAGIKRDGKFRDTFEKEVFTAAQALDPNAKYEPMRVPYQLVKKYIPDIYLSNGIIVEVKGYFTPEDRTKMLAVREQHAGFDIRFVFKRAKSRLASGSTTTYADWCDKHGFKWAEGRIPTEWFSEGGFSAGDDHVDSAHPN